MFDFWISRREELTLAKAQGSQRGESGINHGWARINADERLILVTAQVSQTTVRMDVLLIG